MIKDKKGSILILTLWTLSFLAILAVSLGAGVSAQLGFAKHFQDRLKTYYLAKAGIERAIIQLEADDEPSYDALIEPWANNEKLFKDAPLGDGYIRVGYIVERDTEDENGKELVTLYGPRDESSRININKIPREALETLLQNIGGVEQIESSNIASAIIDWRDKDIIISTGGAEDGYYQGLEAPYPCKNGDFEVAEELLLVKGMTPEIYNKISPVITLYGKGKVNVNTAGELTFYGLGLSLELAERIIQFRRGDDGLEATEDDKFFKAASELKNIGSLFAGEAEQIDKLISLNLFSVTSNVFRINASGVLKPENEERTIWGDLVCVVQRGSDKRSSILYWHEY